MCYKMSKLSRKGPSSGPQQPLPQDAHPSFDNGLNTYNTLKHPGMTKWLGIFTNDKSKSRNVRNQDF